jgi:Tfp pilus assembly protein PilO
MRFDGPVKWYAAAAVASVLVLLAGWFLLVSPQNATAADLSAQAESQVQANQQTEAKIAALKAQYKNLPTLQKQLAVAQTHLPPTPQLPALLRQLSAAAKGAGVTLKSVSPGTPTPLDASPIPAKSGDAAAASEVNVIPVTIMIEGPFANVRLFLSKVESMPRSVLVTGVTITRVTATGAGSGPTTPGNVLTTNITARVFSANPDIAPVATTTSSAAPAAK